MQAITILRNRRIVLGITGSIACYKAVDLASKLTQAGALVDVVMTESAQRFVAPVTFQAVTGRAVYTDMWQSGDHAELPTHIAHVGLGEEADLLAVIPATAHTLARMAQGLADDLLTVTALAVRCPVMVAPAMDGGMYQHPAVQDNLARLKERGVVVVPPDEGRFASGLVGPGRLPETPTLIGHIRRQLALQTKEPSLAGQKVIISAGGTREPLDPVRFITNRSSGKQGYALAQAALDAGAREVALVSTVEDLPVPIGARLLRVVTAQSMLECILNESKDADLLIMAAAVADFRPDVVAEQKIKKDKSAASLTLTLTRTADILLAVQAMREETGYPRLVVGFAAESERLEENARTKLIGKGVDLLIANDILAADAGFGVDTNRVLVLDADGGQQAYDVMSKTAVAEMVIARTAGLLQN